MRRVQSFDQYHNQAKCDLAHMENVAEKAAVLSSFAKEFCREHPIDMSVVEERVLKLWSSGDDRIDMELHAALLDKGDDFEIVKNMPSFKSLLDDSLFKAPVSSAQEESLRDALKRDEYDHLIKKLDYDCKVYEIWQKKCQGVTVARQHARQEHLVAQHKKCLQSVDNFVDGCVRFLTWESCKTSDALIPQILKFRLDSIKKMLGKEIHASEVPTVCLMNWAAPCLLPNTRQNDHMSVLNWAVHDNPNSVGVVFFPTFSTHKGKTFLEETAALNMLSRNGLNLDHQFSVLFSERCDQRDGRPLVYPARFAFPGHLVDLSKSAVFYHSELRKSGRTSEVKQVQGKELKDIEDVAEDGLPSSTNIGFVTGASKYCQLGPLAAEEVLKKLLAGTDLDKLPALLLVDLFPRVGDFCHAFCKLRTQATHNTSLLYVAVAEKGKDLDWMRLTLQEELVDRVKQAQLVLPGMTQPFQQEPNADLLEALPSLPIMNMLVTEGEGEFKKLLIPESVVQKWRSDTEFGEDFGKWLDSFLEKHSIATAPQPSPQDGKRPAPDPSPEQTQQGTPKKARVEEVPADRLLQGDTIPQTLLFDAKLGAKDSLNFQIRTDKTLYLVNLTAQEQALKGHSALVGFGRGSFKLFKDGEVIPEKAIIFDIKKPDQLVCLQGTLQTISEVLNQQRSKNPECQITYHNAEMIPDKPGLFNFTQTLKVGFVPAGAKGAEASKAEEKDDGTDNKVTAANIAAREKPSVFDGSDCVALVWWVRWTVKGLQPVKPMIHILKKVTLSQGQACKLTG